MNSKEVLSLIPHAVCLIGSGTQREKNFMTAAWLTQVSSQPPLVSVSIAKRHYTRELIDRSRVFSVNILNRQGKDIALHCGSTTGRKTNKLEQIEWSVQRTGAPVVSSVCKGLTGFLECEVVDSIETGDHITYIGRIVAGEPTSSDSEPLIYRLDKVE